MSEEQKAIIHALWEAGNVIYRSKNTTKIWICEIYIGNPEIHETLTTLFFGSGMKLFITFLSLRFFDMRRETQFLTILTFPSDPTTCGTPPQTTGLASASSENWLALSNPKSQLTVFFSNSKILCPSLLGMTTFTSPVLFLYLGFLLWHLWLSHPPCAREYLHSMCAPNPCTKPKGSQNEWKK